MPTGYSCFIIITDMKNGISNDLASIKRILLFFIIYHFNLSLTIPSFHETTVLASEKTDIKTLQDQIVSLNNSVSNFGDNKISKL